MAITGQQLCNRALELILELTPGETPNVSESGSILIRLNSLIDNWSIQETMATAAVQASIAMVSGTQSYALATRVPKVVSASIIMSSGPTMPVQMVSAKEWNAIEDRDSLSNQVTKAFYDRGTTTGTIYLSPKPAAGTLTYVAWAAQSQFATLATSVTLQPGYERALTTSLAVEIAPLYGQPISDGLKAALAESMSEIRSLNKTLWDLLPNVDKEAA